MSLSICSGRDPWFQCCAGRSGKGRPIWPRDRPGARGAARARRATERAGAMHSESVELTIERRGVSPLAGPFGRLLDWGPADAHVDRAPGSPARISLRSGDRTERSCRCPSAAGPDEDRMQTVRVHRCKRVVVAGITRRRPHRYPIHACQPERSPGSMIAGSSQAPAGAHHRMSTRLRSPARTWRGAAR